ncbi:hypothetical protein [Streptomyces lydicus]|uniref:hypothetical protein n=1 Tax=Streptomyces lydicus TaxID=47763 RepID=UPI001F50D453|nr:hypothetical protein [Streptomyces lydicus]MCZ1011093.1 hypothetical protein [Streptomyces lydicus]
MLVGPGRYEVVVGTALALAVAIVVIGRTRHPGGSFKILEIADVVFFAAMAVIGIFASPGTLRWLETAPRRPSPIRTARRDGGRNALIARRSSPRRHRFRRRRL